MKISLHLLFTIFIIVCATKCNAFGIDNALQSSINSLLLDLQSTPMDAILYWNFVTVQAGGNDFDTSIVPVPDQRGNARTSRAFTIIHGAMYDAMAFFTKSYKQLFRPKNMPNIKNVDKKYAVDAAIMEAAYQTLRAMYVKQRPIFDAVREQYLRQLKVQGNKQTAIDAGIFVGQSIATFILTDRQNDGNQINIPYAPTMMSGYHDVDPTNPNQGFGAVNWDIVKPFFLNSASQFRPPNIVGDTPATRQQFLNSSLYINNFNEVKVIGSRTSTVRTADQTEIGNFWAYDGAAKIGNAIRMYNQVVRVIAIQQKNTLEQNAHLFALVNFAIFDSAISIFDCKYHYNFWRPIVGIREGSALTQADPNWLPLGSPSNSNDTNFTPPNPAYVSGHATGGAATFETLRLFYKTDSISFQFQSDEYNGKTYDSITRQIRPARTRYYQSFSDAEEEISLSRIYLGIHWAIDQENGLVLGRKTAQFVFSKFC